MNNFFPVSVQICSESNCQGLQRWQYMKELYPSIYKIQINGSLSPLPQVCDVTKKILLFSYSLTWNEQRRKLVFDNTCLVLVPAVCKVVMNHSMGSLASFILHFVVWVVST